MSNYIHQQNCTACDKPGWLIGGHFYSIFRLTINDIVEHRVIVEFTLHRCKAVEALRKEAENAPD